VRATDALKRAACLANGVTLIEVAAVKQPFPPENVLASVARSLVAAGLNETARLPKAELFGAELDDLRAIAVERGNPEVFYRWILPQLYIVGCHGKIDEFPAQDYEIILLQGANPHEWQSRRNDPWKELRG
jgi:hypothetical protein